MAMALRPGTWIDEERFKKTCIKENPKRETIHQPSYGAWVADFMLRQDAGKSMLEKYLSDNSIEAKETFGDGSGRNYSNSQTVNQNRQDAISRVSAVEESARGPRCKHWQSGCCNTRLHQQYKLRMDGNIGYGCPPLHLEAPVWQHACYTKAKKQAQVGCRMWRRARKARGVNTDSLAVATHGYINSASCEWMATLVMAAHHSIWRYLYDSMHAT